MTKPSDEVLQRTLEAVRAEDKMQAFYELLAPLLREHRGAWQRDAAFQLLAAVLSNRGTIDRLRQGLDEFLRDKGVENPRIASARTLRRCLPDFGEHNCSEAFLDYEPWRLEEKSDQVLVTAFAAACHLTTIRDRDFYVVLDVGSRPFYGKSYRRSKKRPERRPEQLTVAGRNTNAALRTYGRMYPGTVNKHDHFLMSIHLYDSNESFPLAVRRGDASADAIKDFIAILDALPVKPLGVLADAAFANHRKGNPLREWCDKNHVLLLTPAPRNEATIDLLTTAWHEKRVHGFTHEGEAGFWSAQEHFWHNYAQRNCLLTLYFQGDPRKDPSDGDEVQQLPNGIFAFSFFVNVAITQDNAVWIWRHYRHRWAIENLFKRYKAYCGVSFSHSMLLRDYMFRASMILLATYALWRLHRRLEDPTATARDYSHSRFFGALHQHAAQAIHRR